MPLVRPLAHTNGQARTRGVALYLVWLYRRGIASPHIRRRSRNTSDGEAATRSVIVRKSKTLKART